MRTATVIFMFFVLAACQPDVAQTGLGANNLLIQKPGKIISVSGKLQYQDRLYTNAGFNTSNMPFKPIRNVPVELRFSGQTVANTQSDAQGNFSFGEVSEGEYTLRIYAQTDHSSGIPIKIFDNSGRQYIIEQAVTVTEQDSHITFDALFSDRIAGIFNMIDVFGSSLDFVSSLAINNFNVEPVHVYWQWGVTRNTYTCRAYSSQCSHGKGIYVLSDPNISGDSDEFDDDVLMHEFAHHLELSMGMTDSPGGMHSLSNYMLDLRLSWSEGMASAFSISAKKWLRENAPERLSIQSVSGKDFTNYYIDTVRNRTLISVDMHSASSAYFRYSSNETAVASSLLRMQNLVGIESTWQNLVNGMSANVTADTFESFWDSMLSYEQPSASNLANWQSAIATKRIYYKTDGAETNDLVNSARNLLMNQEQSHTLYRNHGSKDEDWFSVNLSAGQKVKLQTQKLINGADTHMELYDKRILQLPFSERHLAKIAENDDAFDCVKLPSKCTPLHNGENFSSEITFTSAYAGEYFIRIKTAESVYLNPVSYGYIGRYGGYTILMSPISE